MKTKIFTAIFLTIAFINLSNAQDAVRWTFKIKFKVDVKSIDSWQTGNYIFEDFELFLNEPLNFQNYYGCNIEFDSSTNEYILQLNYHCVSCGYEFKEPVELYIKVNLKGKYYSQTKFSSWIPIYFEKLQSPDLEGHYEELKIVDIGTINIIDFIESKYDNKSKKLLKPFSVINIKSDLSLHKSRENKIRKINRLILLKNFL